MNAAGCFQAGAAGAGFDALIQGLMSGQAATIPLPSLAVAEMQRVNASAKVSVHGFPAPNGSSPELIAGPSFGFSINAHAGAGTKAAAEAFLDWLAKPENAATYAGYEGSIPAASLGDASKIPAAYQSVAQQLTSGHYTYLPSNDWTNPQVYNAMGTGLQALLTKQGSVDSALKSMDQAWDSGN